MFKISDAASLAFHAMAVLAAQAGQGGLTVTHIAERLGVSGHHLAKVMQRLVRARLVRSRRGPQGGFQLARPAAEISLLAVLEAIEGAWRPQGCLLPRPVCSEGCCLLGARMQELDGQVYAHLKGTDLASMCSAFTDEEPA
jgi:Rrf2 family protein